MDAHELFIMLESGLCFYSKSQQQKMDCDLFGGFFTALNSVAQAMGVDEISSLILNHSLYTFSRVYNLLFVVRTDAGKRKDQIEKLLERVKRVFFRHFPPEQYWIKAVGGDLLGIRINNSDRVGSINIDDEKYQMLDTEYEELFADPLERMKMSLWS